MLFVGTGYSQVFSIGQDKKISKINHESPQKNKVIAIKSLNDIISFATQSKIFFITKKTNQIIQTIHANCSDIKIIGFDCCQQENVFSVGFEDGSLNIIKQLNNYQCKPAEKIKFTKEKKFIRSKGSLCFYAFVGFQMNPLIFDIQKNVETWKGKNVAHDELNLRVPIKDVDLAFINEHTGLCVLSSDNQIKIFDIRGTHRRPVQINPLTHLQKFSCATRMEEGRNGSIFVGDDLGGVHEFDSRNNYRIIGACKGSTATVTSLSKNNSLLLSTYADGYARIFDLQSRKLMYQYYFKRPIFSSYLQQWLQLQDYHLQKEKIQEEPQKITKKVKQIRKRNKVGLKYLAKREFDSIVIQNKKGNQYDWKNQLNAIDRKDFE